jgi:hypothetical protein
MQLKLPSVHRCAAVAEATTTLGQYWTGMCAEWQFVVQSRGQYLIINIDLDERWRVRLDGPAGLCLALPAYFAQAKVAFG